MRGFWFFCLTWAAVSDLKTRSISCHLLAVCGIAGMIWAWRRGMADCVAGLPAGFMVCPGKRRVSDRRGELGAFDGGNGSWLGVEYGLNFVPGMDKIRYT